MKKLSLLIIATILSSTFALAQDSVIHRAVQVGLITPLSSNGINSANVQNKFSLNLLGGYSYGNSIFELGGLFNINTHYTSGLQIGGLFNLSGNSNYAVQIGGLFNYNRGGVSAVQIGGLFNVADEIKGLQLGGLANVAKDVKGVQVGGLVNVAKDVKGLQVGLINIAKSVDGAALGLVNIVKEGGKHQLEVAFSDALNTAINFKLGTDALYTIYSVGATYIGGVTEYGIGLGLGTDISWGKSGWANQIEGMYYAMSENQSFEGEWNMLTQLKFTFSKELGAVELFAGPTLNLTASSYVDPVSGKVGSNIVPWEMWGWRSNNSSDSVYGYDMWVGFSFGVRFF